VRASQLALILTAAVLVAGSLIYNAHAHSKGPDIVVYLDKDAKQPAILPLPETKIVAGDRAALWWSVYNKSVERGYGAGDSRYVARDAVEAVYGAVK
jgi:hypothetical protein